MATIEIDGKTFEADNGKMIIEVADEAGIHIPRFCYHKKLSVAANCRMCLVEIENSKKTVPACATPISQGMKVYTQSAAALKSQKAVMEFLLINHPLDCPICDQGGECELQDVSVGYGASHSDYKDTKRSVKDKNLGSLIETEMTRCIHCTRCVRFGEEVAGLREMGAPYRGEHVEIGTYVEASIRSEISGNIIDLCPVGALTSKPYRYAARSWELKQDASIAAHDCLGSHVNVHTRRGQVMRVVAKECESINETWLSDRDRFSYTGLYAEQRLAHPMIKQNGQWRVVDWSSALNFAVSQLGEVLSKHGPESMATFASASSTNEEFYILQKWMQALKVKNMDFRCRQTDFSADTHLPISHQNSIHYADLEHQDNILILGSEIHRELPLAATRIRKAFLNAASVMSLNAVDYEFPFGIKHSIKAEPLSWEAHLLAICSILLKNKAELPPELKKLMTIKVSQVHQDIADRLAAEQSIIVTGHLFENHPRYAVLRTCLEYVRQHTGIACLHFSQGANANGAVLANFIPQAGGKNLEQALQSDLKAVLLHGLEPSYDFSDVKRMRQVLKACDCVIAVTAYETEDLKEYANILLPMANFTETSGSFVNLDANWQSFKGIANAYYEARPAWKIYRVLANLSHCHGFDYTSSEEILAEMKAQASVAQPILFKQSFKPIEQGDYYRLASVPLYSVDILTRHAKALQESAAADRAVIKIHPSLAKKLNIQDQATITQDNNRLRLRVEVDERIHENIICLPVALDQSLPLGMTNAWVGLEA